MGYSMHYEPDKNKIYPPVSVKNRKTGAHIFICVLVLAALLAGMRYRDALVSWIVPGNDQVTIQAAEQMFGQLQDGVPLGEAVTAFCQEIIANGR